MTSILVVDDNPMDRRVAGSLLEAEGWEILYAENENYVVLVDGVETKYTEMKFPNDYVVSFVITETTKNIAIIGTKIIPEFGMLSIVVLGISTQGMMYFIQRSKLKIYS